MQIGFFAKQEVLQGVQIQNLWQVQVNVLKILEVKLKDFAYLSFFSGKVILIKPPPLHLLYRNAGRQTWTK